MMHALHAMTEQEMREAAQDDPDAQEMTAEMLAHRAPYLRLERSKVKREGAVRALAEEAKAEAKAMREREKMRG